MSTSNSQTEEYQKALMEKGIFPENVPPVFQVQNFFRVAHEQGLLDVQQIDKKPTRLSNYNETKRGGQRRIFSTPNPLFFIDAASFFTKYRRQIDECLKKSDYSCSIPVFDNKNSRFVRINSHAEFTRARRERLASSRYIVKADISRFYSSIYTHSIPWAMHGKPKSKKDRDPNSNVIFANKLDYLIRQSQDQQTIGIPVGPDTSKIVSELIAGAVDVEFKERVGDEVAGARLVDDIYLGAKNLDEAEKFLSVYQHSLRQYELDVNENKTNIFEARYDLEPFWTVEIRREFERFAGSNFPSKTQLSDMTIYLDEIVRNANQTGDDGIIKFAIRAIDRQRLWMEYWDAIEPFLIRVAMVFPHCIDYVARVVVWYCYLKLHVIDKDKWKDVCEKIIAHHAPLGNDSEVVWACWLLKELNTKIHRDNCEKIINHCGPFSVLLILDLYSLGLVSGRFPRKLINERIRENSMLESDWLLQYEAVRSFDYKLKQQDGEYNEVLKQLIDGGVQFYKSTASPVVFDGIDEENFNEVELAIEDRDGFYESEDEYETEDLERLFDDLDNDDNDSLAF